MGKHKTTHHRRRVSGHTTRRRRRVGASDTIKNAVLLGVGALGGGIITPFLVQGINTAMGSGASAIPAWMVPGGGAATGIVIAGVGFAHKNPLMIGFGGGMAGIGGAMAANEIGLSEPGISGTAFSNNSAPGSTAATTSIGCRSKVGSPQRYVNNSVGNMSRMEAQAIGALYSN